MFLNQDRALQLQVFQLFALFPVIITKCVPQILCLSTDFFEECLKIYISFFFQFFYLHLQLALLFALSLECLLEMFNSHFNTLNLLLHRGCDPQLLRLLKCVRQAHRKFVTHQLNASVDELHIIFMLTKVLRISHLKHFFIGSLLSQQPIYNATNQKNVGKSFKSAFKTPTIKAPTIKAQPLKKNPNSVLAVAERLNLNESAVRQQMIDPQKDVLTDEQVILLGMINNISLSPKPVSKMCKKSPVVTIMGHVDHGKTTLIDYLRKSNIAEKEDGGITQKIGAFHIICHGEKITFIDTPGHQAFTNMRERGASVTDLVVLIVSAAEGVKKQTEEVIALINAENIRCIVAINKIDLPQANPEEVEEALFEAGLNIQPKGGKIPVIHISAKEGINVDLLSELIIQETKEIKQIEEGLSEGVILEAYHNHQSGAMTVIVQKGTMKVGSLIVVGDFSMKIKSMQDDRGNQLAIAKPGDAVQIVGIPNIPNAGDFVYEVANQTKAKYILEKRKMNEDKKAEDRIISQKSNIKISKITLGWRERKKFYSNFGNTWLDKYNEKEEEYILKIDELKAKNQTEEIKEKIANLEEDLRNHREYVYENFENLKDNKDCMNVVLKFAERGMEETAMIHLPVLIQKVKDICGMEINIKNSSIGEIIPSDIREVKLLNAEFFSFGCKMSAMAAAEADTLKVIPKNHKLIHTFLKDFEESAYEKKRGSIKGIQRGRGDVVDIFTLKAQKKGEVGPVVAGVKVTDGKLIQSAKFYIFRRGLPVSNGIEVRALKVFKKEQEEVKRGDECTVTFCEDQSKKFQVGDQIYCFEDKP